MITDHSFLAILTTLHYLLSSTYALSTPYSNNLIHTNRSQSHIPPINLSPPPDPLILYRTVSSTPPTTLALKLHSYGNPNSPLHLQYILETALLECWTIGHDITRVMIDDKPIVHVVGEGGMVLDFVPVDSPKAVATMWGQWRTVLGAMEEFLKWYQSRDFFFEIRLFEEGRAGRGLGQGVLWTGLDGLGKELMAT